MATRFRLRVPAALAVALVGASMSIGTAIYGCSPADEPPPGPDASRPQQHLQRDAAFDGDAGVGDAGAGGVDGPVVDAPLQPPHT